MKRIFYLLLTIALLLCASSTGAYAVEPTDAEAAAAELAALGLFRGNGAGFDLEQPCNRLHGAVLFTRLLGKEEEALANPRPHPFRDIGQESWAAPYLGYLYNNGLAYGLASDRYGAEQMQPNHFATFCLRALGYTEGSANSDFRWSEALDVMVEQEIISGALRNRLRYTALFTRGDAATLAYATLSAPVKQGGQTLLERLTAEGAVSAEQAATFSVANSSFNIIFPDGLLANDVLSELSAKHGLSLGRATYAPGAESEEELYRRLREPGQAYDICVVPGYLVERLRQDGLLKGFIAREFGGREIIVEALRDNPYWYDDKSSDYYALPLAFETPLLYYDAARVQNPDWGWLLREAYSGGVYMPADPVALVSLAMHYYGYPYSAATERQTEQAVKLLSEQSPAVPAYLSEHMLDIPQREGAVFGVISSRELPELEQRRASDEAYANWQATLPQAGGPLTVYYAVIMRGGNEKAAISLLKDLLQPQTAAVSAQQGGYLPAAAGAGAYLTGAVGEAYPAGRWARCRLLNLDASGRAYYEQTARNALLDEANRTLPPEIISLDFTFSQAGAVTRTCQVTVDDYPAARAKNFRRDAARLGLALWKQYYDGLEDAPWWSMTITFADGTSKIYQGGSLPPTWQDIASSLATLCGEEVIPPTL